MKIALPLLGLLLIAIGGFGRVIKQAEFKKICPGKIDHITFHKKFNASQQSKESRKYDVLYIAGLAISILPIFIH